MVGGVTKRAHDAMASGEYQRKFEQLAAGVAESLPGYFADAGYRGSHDLETPSDTESF